MGYICRLLRLGEGKAKARAKGSTDSLILGPRCVYTCPGSGGNVPTQVHIHGGDSTQKVGGLES